MRTAAEKRVMLRRAIDGDRLVVAPGAFCALIGRMIEQAGFPAVYVSGYATAAAVLSEPDIGTVTLTEMAENAGRVASAVDVPVISDADTGYGDVANVARTVRMFEEVGVAAIHLQDKVWPVGSPADRKAVIEPAAMAAKIRAAIEARTDPNFIIIARTDARMCEDIDTVIARANLYRAAGADVIFVEEPESLDEVKALPERIDAPLFINICEGYPTPMLSVGELEKLRYRIVIYPITTLLATVTRVKGLLESLKSSGDIVLAGGELVSEVHVDEVVGMARAVSLYDSAFELAATDG